MTRGPVAVEATASTLRGRADTRATPVAPHGPWPWPQPAMLGSPMGVSNRARARAWASLYGVE